MSWYKAILVPNRLGMSWYEAILMPKRLDMSWYEAICLSISGLDIVFKTASELAKFMSHTHEDIPV
jgi:hypothetical protein